MSRPEMQQNNPLRHRCYMTKGRFGFISYIDFSDIIVLGATFYFSTLLAAKLFVRPAPKLLLSLVMLILAWVINFGVKRRLMPYPGVLEHFTNWWFGGVDSYVPEVDENPRPLLVTREMQVGDAVMKAATQVRVKTKPERERRPRVRQKAEKAN